MNIPRIAALLRELADAFEEAFEEDALSERVAPEEKKPRSRVRRHPPPPGPTTDVAVARARRMLRERGIT